MHSFGAVHGLGLRTLPPFDILRGPHFDLYVEEVQRHILAHLKVGRVW